jgi:hypothetical protein
MAPARLHGCLPASMVMPTKDGADERQSPRKEGPS